MSVHGDVITFNLFELSWDELVQKGFDRYVDKEKYETYQQTQANKSA
ncbi:hypothetical protein [Bacillus taeanensis]|nr:hypothetical protein [Bacillus taeanensis]